jgi:hypothetical protein
LSVGDQSPRARRAEIKDIKPKGEIALGLSLLRKITPEDLPTKAWKAYAAYDKACDAYGKARDALCKACDDFFASLTPAQWDRWHKKVCKRPDCKWTAEHPSIF